jgi:hypothetical protein
LIETLARIYLGRQKQIEMFAVVLSNKNVCSCNGIKFDLLWPFFFQ